MKTYLTITTLISLISVSLLTGFLAGFNIDNSLGGVRGGARTGFHLLPGEQIGIGTSTLTYDLEIVSHSTSTIKLGKDLTAISTGGCLIVDDYDGTGSTYCNYNDGLQTCSSTDICN